MRSSSALFSTVVVVLAAFAGQRADAAALPRFPSGAVWNQDISSAAVHPNSAGAGGMIATLAGICGGDYPGCGFGFGRMQIDFSIDVLNAPVGAPTAPIVEHQTYFDYYLPDCEPLGTTMPLPVGGAIEGSPTNDYHCDNANDDCHLLVVQGNTLYEAYSANLTPGNQIEALCLAVWNLDVVYPPEGRGDHCTSADGAGFPIAALLFNADDIRTALAQPVAADRHLGHALRFILPNDKMASLPDGPDPGTLRDRVYVRPATHAGGPDGPTGSVPYGSRLRLRSDFPFTGYNAATQVILRTMQKYGIVLADGGGIALTAQDDQFTTAKWSDADIDIGSRVFDQTAGATAVSITDFAVLDTGAQILETYNCVRTTIPTDGIFQDGYE
jgi:serine/threonine-protein kinase